MHFGFTLELSNVDLLNIDLLDTHLDLLDTDIPSKYFACLHNVFKTSSRHVFKTSSRYVFKTSSRLLQRNNFSSSKTPSRLLGRRKIVTPEDVLKTSSRPTNVCWVASMCVTCVFVHHYVLCMYIYMLWCQPGRHIVFIIISISLCDIYI